MRYHTWLSRCRPILLGGVLAAASTGYAQSSAGSASVAAPSSDKAIVCNDDGWSSYMRCPAPMNPEDIVRVTVGPVIGTRVRVYQFCALGGHAVNYQSTFLPRVGEMMDRVDGMHVWRMRTTLRHLEQLKTDPLRIIAKACRENGIACQFSLRMNDAHHTYRRSNGSWYFPELRSPWFDQHKEALLPNGTLDYEHPDVAAYRKQQIQEVLDRYDVGGIDLDFTRFKPWFKPGREKAGAPKMTQLIRDLRAMTRASQKTLSARLEYAPSVCIDSGLDVETWLAEGLLDQITLGVTSDHTPEAPSEWWVVRAHAKGCKVYPSMEGQLHWLITPGAGGTGTRAAVDGVHDGFGPPSMAYMRAFAALHYSYGADGICLFNFTCADGGFDRAAFTELADPAAIAFKDKQYVVAVWPHGTSVYHSEWTSRFRLPPGEKASAFAIRIADDVGAAAARGYSPRGLLTLDLKGINRIDDVDVRLNGTPVRWTGEDYNHYDQGYWNDVIRYEVPAAAIRSGQNTLELVRVKDNPGFAGSLEVRKLILEVRYDSTVTPGRIAP